MEQKRSTFPTSIKTLDGERRVPTEAELDQMLFDLVKDKLGGNDPDPTPGPTVPTDAELRDQARQLGLPVPPPRQGTAEWFRDDMLNLLDGSSR
jgi:hypothetical protein